MHVTIAGLTRVLIVDDDVHVRRLIALQLKNAGHEAAQVGSGEEAIAAVSASTFDVALIDMILPQFGGFRLCQKLKNQERAPRLVIMTGDEAPETPVQAIQCGADAFLRKPFTMAEMLEAVSGHAATT